MQVHSSCCCLLYCVGFRMHCVNPQATKFFLATSATRGVATTPLDLDFGFKYRIVNRAIDSAIGVGKMIGLRCDADFRDFQANNAYFDYYMYELIHFRF